MGRISLLIMPIGYVVFLVWQEWRFRERLAMPLPILVATLPVPIHKPLDATAVATVLGLIKDTALLASTEPLTLQASFVVSNGVSKALLADAQGPRMYQMGERLPGGSVLRRVEANQVVLWNKGREERLALQAPAERFLRRLGSPGDLHNFATPARYLRPLTGPSE
ncbi:type II secretion system protein N [Pseudomonas sp. NFX98]|uniref:type II secretion system protein N n=1 Tax=Pseudomonas sp. NFX98 TaxID=3399122 RepID=UPI0039FBDE82